MNGNLTIEAKCGGLVQKGWCLEPESNRHAGLTQRRILSPLCLPISPPRLAADLEAGVGIEPAYTALQAAA
jgi:hypothetical protein